MRQLCSLTCHIALISIFSILACNPISKTSDSAVNEKIELTYLALGDSYTIGEGVGIDDRWPNQLSNELSNSKVQIVDTKIIARTGWTTRNLLDALNEQKPSKHDLVSLLIGVNNQYQGLSFSTFEEEFILLLDSAITLSRKGKKRVFVVSIPDYGLTPFVKENKETIAAELDRYNAYMQSECEKQGIPFIDITSVSRSLGSLPDAIAKDGLHPSGYQYMQWVNEIFPVVERMLL